MKLKLGTIKGTQAPDQKPRDETTGSACVRACSWGLYEGECGKKGKHAYGKGCTSGRSGIQSPGKSGESAKKSHKGPHQKRQTRKEEKGFLSKSRQTINRRKPNWNISGGEESSRGSIEEVKRNGTHGRMRRGGLSARRKGPELSFGDSESTIGKIMGQDQK